MAKAPTTKAVANYNDRLAALASKAVEQEANVGGGSFISTKGGHFGFNGGIVPGDKMNVIVLDHVSENCFYDGARYDPDNPSSPACFAFFRTEDEAHPHEKSESPQCDDCKSCPQNVFGSADTGKGKACKNIRRLALITEDGMEDIANATVSFLKVPVTSVANWAGYVNSLNTSLKLPPVAVITEMSIVPDPKTQFKLKFRLVEQIEDNDVIGALLDKMETVEKDLTHPYTPNSERTEQAPPASKAARGGRGAPPPKASPKLGARR